MLYTGYNEDELKELILILEKYKIPFHVASNDEAIEYAHAVMKNRSHHLDKTIAKIPNGFYNVEIGDDELKKLSPDALKELETMRVIPLMEMLPEEPKAIVGKPVTHQAVGMGMKTIVFFFLAIIAWYFFIQE